MNNKVFCLFLSKHPVYISLSCSHRKLTEKSTMLHIIKSRLCKMHPDFIYVCLRDRRQKQIQIRYAVDYEMQSYLKLKKSYLRTSKVTDLSSSSSFCCCLDECHMNGISSMPGTVTVFSSLCLNRYQLILHIVR